MRLLKTTPTARPCEATKPPEGASDGERYRKPTRKGLGTAADATCYATAWGTPVPHFQVCLVSTSRVVIPVCCVLGCKSFVEFPYELQTGCEDGGTGVCLVQSLFLIRLEIPSSALPFYRILNPGPLQAC